MILLVCRVWASLSASGAERLYNKPVKFKEYRDPLRIFLTDGAKLSVRFTNIKFKEGDEWKQGEILYVAFASSRGAVLVDPGTKIIHCDPSAN